MRDCKRCTRPNLHDEYFPPGGQDSFLPFEVLSIIDSAHNPVEQEIFNKTKRPEGVYVRTFDKRTLGDTDFKGRPAIVLDSGHLRPTEDELVRTRVLLMATYRGEYPDRQHLPLILQRFGVAIYQHEAIAGEPDKFHLHTWPEWTNSHPNGDATNAWLIAREYPFEGELAERHAGRWMNAKRVRWRSCSSFTLEEEFKTEIGKIMDEEWDTWTSTCQSQPENLIECVRDYLDFSNRLGKYRRRTGQPRPRKQTPYRNTTPTHTKAVPPTATKDTQNTVKRVEPSIEMLQRKPFNFAHPSLARPLAEQSAASATDTLGSTPMVAAAASSSERTPPVTAQIVTKPEAAELVGTTSPSAPVPPKAKATYAQMLKAGVASSQPAQRPAREMMPA